MANNNKMINFEDDPPNLLGPKEWRKCLFCRSTLVDRNQQCCFCDSQCDWQFRAGMDSDTIQLAVAANKVIPIFRTKPRKIDIARDRKKGEYNSNELIGRFCALEECHQFFVTHLKSKKYHKYECQIRGQYLSRLQKSKERKEVINNDKS